MSIFQTVDLELPAGKSIFFASDFHLGSLKGEEAKRQERDLVTWLKSVRDDAACLFLVGDVFDYWFEYKHVVHKGNVRVLGQLADIADSGVQIYYFTGNHDMWVRDYFATELNAFVSRKPVSFAVVSPEKTTRMLVGHGDGLGPGDRIYKRLKTLFENPWARVLFRQVHPDLATRLAFAWSKHSRASNSKKGEEQFKGEQNEWLYLYCLEMERIAPHDYYIFGHRHLPLDLRVGNSAGRYINLGEWFSPGSRYPYASFDGTEMELKYFR